MTIDHLIPFIKKKIGLRIIDHLPVPHHSTCVCLILIPLLFKYHHYHNNILNWQTFTFSTHMIATHTFCMTYDHCYRHFAFIIIFCNKTASCNVKAHHLSFVINGLNMFVYFMYSTEYNTDNTYVYFKRGKVKPLDMTVFVHFGIPTII